MPTQGLGGPQIVRWLQRRGQEDTVLWDATEKSSWVPSSGHTVWLLSWVLEVRVTGVTRGHSEHCVTGTFFSCVALPQLPVATKQDTEQVA